MTENAARLLRKSPLGAVLHLGLPLLAAAGFQLTFNLCEVFIFGQIGDRGASLAGAAASDLVTAVFAVLAFGLGNAAVSQIAYCQGAGDVAGARRHTRQALVLAGVLSVLSAVVGLLAGPIGSLVMAEGATRAAGTPFLRVMALGGCGTIGVAYSIAILRAMGDTVRPLIVVAIMSMSTLALEAILVLGLFGARPHGIMAAAWVTVGLRILSAGVLLGMIHRHLPVLPPAGERFVDRRALRTQLDLGLAAAAHQTLRLLGFLVLLGMAAHRFGGDGDPTFTAVNIWIKLDAPTLTLAFAWGGAVAPLVGFGLGTRRPKFSVQAAWAGVACACLTAGITTVVAFSLAPSIIEFMLPDDPGAVVMGADLLRWGAWGYVFVVVGIVISNAYNGAGDMRTPLAWDTAIILLFQSGAAGLLARPSGLAATGLAAAVLASRVLQAVVPALLLRRAPWHRQRALPPADIEPPSLDR